MSPRLPYPDIPWLSSELLRALLDDAYALGDCQFRYYPAADGGVEWDDVMSRLESGLPSGAGADGFMTRLELPLTYDHPLMNRIKKAYRKGYRENNE